jgi:hypothetical protein
MAALAPIPQTIMSALENQFHRARAVLESLVQGTHPRTGCELPGDCVVREVEIKRAMAIAVLALDQMRARLARRAELPESGGRMWTEEEEKRLVDAFRRGDSVRLLATRHERTVRAIEARLAKCGVPPYTL